MQSSFKPLKLALYVEIDVKHSIRRETYASNSVGLRSQHSPSLLECTEVWSLELHAGAAITQPCCDQGSVKPTGLL